MLPDGISLRAARPGDAPVCRMLLPEASRGGLHQFLIAAVPDRPFVAGIAAFVRLPESVVSVQVHVLPAMRRRGVGSLLLQRICESAEAWRAASVSGWVDVLQSPDALQFAAVQGFSPGGTLTTAECDGRVTFDYFDRIRKRWAGRPPGAAGFQLVRLSEANLAAVARLWNQYIVHSADYRTDIVSYQLGQGVLKDSAVLLKDGEVAGMMLFRFDGDCMTVVAKVISPEARDGWTAAALNFAGCDEAHAHGATRLRFEWRDGTSYTAKVARRLQGRTIRQLRELIRRYPPPQGEFAQRTA